MVDMELRHLRHFVTVAEDLHFGRAAERLHISQPTLSQSIKALEQLLGVRLLERTKHAILLTVAGALFLKEARLTLRQAEHARLVGEQASRAELGRIEIGYRGSAASTGMLPSLVFAYRQAHLSVDINLRELPTGRLLDELGTGRLDIAFIRLPISSLPHTITSVTLIQEPLVVALRRDHSLAKHDAIPVSALAEEAFVATHAEDGSGLSEQVDAICRQRGFVPRIVQESNELVTIVSLVGAGIGVAIVPDSLRAVHPREVVYRPLSDVDDLSELAVAFRRDERAPAVKAFIKLARELSKRNASPSTAPASARLDFGVATCTRSEP